MKWLWATVGILAVASCALAQRSEDNMGTPSEDNMSTMTEDGVTVQQQEQQQQQSQPQGSPSYGQSSYRWPQSRFQSRFGAIAYSKQSGRWGTSYNFASRAEAERRAISECGQKDCRTAVWMQNGACGALAKGSQSSWGATWAVNQATAEQKALALCQSQKHAACRVVAVTCAYGSGIPPVAGRQDQMIASSATSFAFHQVYLCNGERVSVAHCGSPARGDYCEVEYIDRKYNGFMVQKAEHRSDIARKLQSCTMK